MTGRSNSWGKLEENVSGREIGNYFYHFYERDNIGIYQVKKNGKDKFRAEYICTTDDISNAQDICYSLNTNNRIKDVRKYLEKKRTKLNMRFDERREQD